jgi:hypothetical protein
MKLPTVSGQLDGLLWMKLPTVSGQLESILEVAYKRGKFTNTSPCLFVDKGQP